ncbi:hypothetical protein LJC32_00010 [Oscillospiraceae bacterium OttesenSCG-928-F05]|nr:hypothetical protein [Oscillospiraceae bacterium OttesenSCG-928-F05]
MMTFHWRRAASFICAFSLLLSAGALAADTKKPETVEVGYEELQTYVEEANYTYQLTLHQLETSKAGYNEIKSNIDSLTDSYWMVHATASTGSGALSQLTSSMHELRKQAKAWEEDEATRELGRKLTLESQLMATRLVYTSLLSLEIQVTLNENALTDLQSRAGAYAKKLSAGLISRETYDDYMQKIDDQAVALEKATTSYRQTLDDFKVQLGLTAEDTLLLSDPAAEFDFSVIDAIDAEADKAAYLASNLSIEDARLAIKKAEKTYRDNNSKVNKFGIEQAKMAYNQTVIDEGASYDKELQSLKDKLRDLRVAEKELARQEKTLASMQTKLKAGLVAPVQVQTLEQAVTALRLQLDLQQIQLYNSYQCYMSALEGGLFAVSASSGGTSGSAGNAGGAAA